MKLLEVIISEAGGAEADLGPRRPTPSGKDRLGFSRALAAAEHVEAAGLDRRDGARLRETREERAPRDRERETRVRRDSRANGRRSDERVGAAATRERDVPESRDSSASSEADRAERRAAATNSKREHDRAGVRAADRPDSRASDGRESTSDAAGDSAGGFAAAGERSVDDARDEDEARGTHPDVAGEFSASGEGAADAAGEFEQSLDEAAAAVEIPVDADTLESGGSGDTTTAELEGALTGTLAAEEAKALAAAALVTEAERTESALGTELATSGNAPGVVARESVLAVPDASVSRDAAPNAATAGTASAPATGGGEAALLGGDGSSSSQDTSSGSREHQLGGQGAREVESGSPRAIARETVDMRPDRNDVGERLGRIIFSRLRGGENRFRLQIHPQRLGHLDVQLDLSGKSLKLSIGVESDAARHLLHARSGELQSALQSHGLELEQLRVSVDAHGGSRQAFAESRQGRDTKPNRTDESAASDLVDGEEYEYEERVVGLVDTKA